jgi:uncharacterized protein (TIGR03435 family)
MRLLILLSTAALVTAAVPDDPLRFEVASVRLTPRESIRTGYGYERVVARPGSVMMHNLRRRACIKWAYDVKDYQITAPGWMGAPGWLGADLDRFEIAAKASPDTSVVDLKRMMQTLLAERFKLEFHRQPKEFGTLVMTVGKKGLSLQSSKDPEGDSLAVAPPQGSALIILQSTTLSQLADLMSGPLRMPIIDKTGVDGRFDLRIDMAPYMASGGQDPMVLASALEEQLGLKLEKQKTQIEMLIIDHVEKTPTEN